MHLIRRPFRLPWRCASAIRSASLDAACPGLHRKPLDATIRQILSPYCPGSRQGDNQHNDDAICTHFAGHFDGHHDVPVLYRGFVAFIKATKCHHRASTRSDVTNRIRQCRLLWTFHRKKELQLTCLPRITIGV